MTLEEIEEKWIRKTNAGFRENWVRMVKKAESFDLFVKGISAVTGIPEATVRASLPAKNWKDFQENAEDYLDIAIAKIDAAYRAKKWSKRYGAAFGG